MRCQKKEKRKRKRKGGILNQNACFRNVLSTSVTYRSAVTLHHSRRWRESQLRKSSEGAWYTTTVYQVQFSIVRSLLAVLVVFTIMVARSAALWCSPITSGSLSFLSLRLLFYAPFLFCGRLSSVLVYLSRKELLFEA